MAFFSLLWVFLMLRAYIGKKLFPILWNGTIAHPFVEYKAEKWNWSNLVKTKHFPYLRKIALCSSAQLWLPEKGKNLSTYAWNHTFLSCSNHSICTAKLNDFTILSYFPRSFVTPVMSKNAGTGKSYDLQEREYCGF